MPRQEAAANHPSLSCPSGWIWKAPFPFHSPGGKKKEITLLHFNPLKCWSPNWPTGFCQPTNHITVAKIMQLSWLSVCWERQGRKNLFFFFLSCFCCRQSPERGGAWCNRRPCRVGLGKAPSISSLSAQQLCFHPAGVECKICGFFRKHKLSNTSPLPAATEKLCSFFKGRCAFCALTFTSLSKSLIRHLCCHTIQTTGETQMKPKKLKPLGLDFAIWFGNPT